MSGDQENQENKELMEALKEHYPEEQPQSFVIPDSDLQAPSELSNSPFQPIPEAAGPGATETLPVAGDQAADFPSGTLEPIADIDSDNPDPALAVDEMLSAAVLEEEMLPELPVDTLEAPLQPSFQVHFHPADEAQQAAIGEIAKSLGLAAGGSIFSQLTEYQAVVWKQQAAAQGIQAEITVKFPVPAMTEEEQALGDLAAVPESPLLDTEGAPAVVLPKREREVLLTTEESPALTILEGKGIVTAHRSLARRFFREEEAQEKLMRELQKLPGRQAAIPASRLDLLYRELFLDLQKSALSRGANAVTGIRLEAFAETTSLDPALEQMRLVAFGTAAVVEKP